MSTHKILVIDDSMVIRRTVKDMLPAGNFEVIEAKNGVEGFKLIRSENPNLIMLDFLMPKMGGWEVYLEMQQDPALKAIPLVFMSGRKEEITEKVPEPFEFFSFIEKPFDKKQLIDAIKEAMVKAKKIKVEPATAAAAGPSQTTGTGGGTSEEVAALRSQVETLTQEVDKLKTQMAQLVTIIRQKLK